MLAKTDPRRNGLKIKVDPNKTVKNDTIKIVIITFTGKSHE